MKKILCAAAAAGLALVSAPAQGQDAIDTSWVRVKKAIADTMTPEQLQAYKERLARNFGAKRGLSQWPQAANPNTPGDTCLTSTYEIGAVPYGPVADTTAGATDNFDLPADTANPTCVITGCTGAGPAGSLPGGAIYTGTGTGPDRGWHIKTDANCTLTINMDPTGAEDLALIVYQTQCSSSLSDCTCVDDTGVGGAAEAVTLNAVAGTEYFVVVDGYSSGGTPPGPSGPYTLQIAGAGCNLVPVKMDGFSIQ